MVIQGLRLLLVVAVALSLTCSKAAIICENKQGTINCPDGGSLNILSASYGRSSPDTCPHPRPATMTKTDCDSPNDILSIVKEHCKSQSSTSVCKIKPSNGLFRGDPCVGTYKYLTVEFECKDPDPVDGGWSLWDDWSTCSTTCATGIKSRSRTCTNPVPANGGADCVGNSTETISCTNAQECPVDGGWTEYGDWSVCTQPCGTGLSFRTRSCTNPSPTNGGTDCQGSAMEMTPCNEDPCPVVDSCTPNYPPANCEDIRLANPDSPSDTYTIQTSSGENTAVFCDFYYDRSYMFLSKDAITKLDTDSLRKMYTIRDHALIRMVYNTSHQHDVEIAQLLPFANRYPLSFQIGQFKHYTRPINSDLRRFLYVGFLPSDVVQQNVRGYRAGGKNVQFSNCGYQPNNFIVFYADDEFATRDRYQWFIPMETADPVWYLNNQPIAQERRLPEEFFMEYEMRMGGCEGYSTSLYSKSLLGIMGVTVGLGYENRKGC